MSVSLRFADTPVGGRRHDGLPRVERAVDADGRYVSVLGCVVIVILATVSVSLSCPSISATYYVLVKLQIALRFECFRLHS